MFLGPDSKNTKKNKKPRNRLVSIFRFFSYYIKKIKKQINKKINKK